MEIMKIELESYEKVNASRMMSMAQVMWRVVCGKVWI